MREIEHRCITAVCWNSFFGLVVKTVGSYFVSRFGRQNRNSGGRRCRVYRRCRVWTDVEPVGAVRGSSGVRLEPVCDVRDRLTTRECDRWLEEIVTSSQPVLLPGELGSSRQSVRLGSSSTESPADVTDDRPP